MSPTQQQQHNQHHKLQQQQHQMYKMMSPEMGHTNHQIGLQHQHSHCG